MKVKYQNYLPDEGPELVAVAYRYKKGGPWHIYESALYDIEGEVDVQELIQEVMGERHVSRKNIRIVKPKYVMCEIQYDS